MGVPGDREINTTGVDRCKPAENVYLTCWGIFLTGALIFFFQFHFVFCFGILMQSSRWLREINWLAIIIKLLLCQMSPGSGMLCAI